MRGGATFEAAWVPFPLLSSIVFSRQSDSSQKNEARRGVWRSFNLFFLLHSLKIFPQKDFGEQVLKNGWAPLIERLPWQSLKSNFSSGSPPTTTNWTQERGENDSDNNQKKIYQDLLVPQKLERKIGGIFASDTLSSKLWKSRLVLQVKLYKVHTFGSYSWFQEGGYGHGEKF